MGHPVTTNPFIIMLINMTIVFIVLVSLSFLITLIHKFDPTAKKEEEEEPKFTAPKISPSAPAPPTEPEPLPTLTAGIPEETIAAICAAITAYGYSVGQIHAIRPVYNKIWEHSGRYTHKPL